MGQGQLCPSQQHKEANVCNCLQLLNREIQAAFDRLEEARAKTRAWLPTYGECVQAYEAVEAKEQQLQALENFRVILEKQGG